MTRTKSHFQANEPILEYFLQRLRFNMVSSFVNKGDLILDLGCGYNGKLLNKLSPKISEGIGFDISVTKKAIANNIKLISIKKDGQIDLPNNHFDLVVCLAVIEHLENPLDILKTAYKSVKEERLRPDYNTLPRGKTNP